ncbi:FecR domain-containing protein [Gemmatimonadota bacterium]
MEELILRALSGEASPFEIERLTRWREESPEHERFFQETAQVWTLTAPEPVAISSEPPEVCAIVGKADPTQEPRGVAKARRRWFGWRGAGLLAASVAALAIGMKIVSPGGPVSLASFQASAGEALTVTLSDGSFVRLAKGSRLEEWEADGSREVSLDGRAFFAVARDETRPFVVRAGEGEVRVLGTRFEVAREEGGGSDGGIRVVVVEGRVEVSNPSGSVEVPAGSVARMRAGEPPSSEVADDVYALLDWTDGVLVFHGTPLGQVAREVSRHYGRSLAVAGEVLGGRRITAWFQGDPFEEIAEALCQVAEAVCRIEGSGVQMDPGIDRGGSR